MFRSETKRGPEPCNCGTNGMVATSKQSAPQDPEIRQTLTELYETADSLRNSVEKLAERVAPVLRAIPTDDVGIPQQVRGTMLASEMQNTITVLRRTLAVVSVMHETLEL